jgi:hypothetical protein
MWFASHFHLNEVLAGPERRHPWSIEQKQAIVAAAFEPGAVVRDVARRGGRPLVHTHDLCGKDFDPVMVCFRNGSFPRVWGV